MHWENFRVVISVTALAFSSSAAARKEEDVLLLLSPIVYLDSSYLYSCSYLRVTSLVITKKINDYVQQFK